MALHEAGISDFNIMTYSSVLPACAEEVPKDEARLPVFGSEMMTIMATAHGEKGDHICAGIIYGWMYDKDKKVGGLVCEVAGVMEIDDICGKLEAAIYELHDRTYAQYELRDIHLYVEPHKVSKAHGTALVAICFTEFK